MYVTLEPCAHHGKTPPCADAIVAAGLKRVVVGTGDPDPRTAGKGIARLCAAGIEVTEGVLVAQARWMTLGHILRVTKKRPFVQIKMALSDESTVPRGYGGKPVIVTCEEARAQGHLLRAEADAILVGRKTVEDDDPELTCRLPGLVHRSPIRVVVASQPRKLVGSKLVATARDVRVWLLTGPEAHRGSLDALEQAGVRVFGLPAVTGQLQPGAIVETLAAKGITRLLVEGGPAVWKSFASARLADEVVVFHAHVAGHGMADYQQSVEHAVAHYLAPLRLEVVESRRVGADTMWRLRPKASAALARK